MKSTWWKNGIRLHAVLLGAAVLLLMAGCPLFPPADGGDGGDDGDATATLSGTVTNSATGEGIEGVEVTTDPAVEDVEIVTDANGAYAAALPTGVYTLTFEHEYYDEVTKSVAVLSGTSAAADVALDPTNPVALSVTVDGDAAPGAALTATVTAEVLDGTTTISGYTWAQANSVTVTFGDAAAASTTVTLPDVAAYKAELMTVLMEPPITEAQLPDNVPLPETEDGAFPGGLADRFQVVGMSPFALEEAGLVTIEVTVSTSSGDFTEEAEVHATLPWKSNPGLRNVPIGIPILLHGKTQDSYDWALTPPGGSSAALTDGTTQNPYFTPDVAGQYVVTVTNLTVDPAEIVTLNIYAGEWFGAISGQDAQGLPQAQNCTICHNGNLAEATFDEWNQSGHAEIFTYEIEEGDHYRTSCLPCHTVGYDTDVDNGGFDDADDYQDFLDAFTSNGTNFVSAEGNWETMLDEMPDTAQLANVQCENCHGPNSTSLHFNEIDDPERISQSSDVCAVCHGEPLRHGRFQQWQLSGHANYETAIAEGTSGSCSRCHSSNGFLEWLPVLLGDEAGDPDDSVTVAWEEDDVHPITCVVCHDPHNVGTTTGVETDATVRIYGDTPELIAGFTAYGVGNAAICMTCHNSRRGLRNDDTFADTVADEDTARAPHGSAQTDVLFGQNAYLVTVGIRGSHALVENACVECHMTSTPPPDILSYNQGGTNHTFFAADDICAECHSEVLTAGGIVDAVEGELATLQGLIEDALLDLITEQIAGGNKIDVDGEVTITDAATIADIEFTEFRGRQGVTITFSDETSVGPVGLPDVIVLDAGDNELGELYSVADARLPKAGWNYFLVHNDGSHGVHNPSFVFEVLSASANALNNLAAE